MNSKIKNFIRNFSYSLIANLVSIIISTFFILIIPKFISVEDYGYWQLYIFYTSYITCMSFGLTEGVYLRYGGNRYRDLYKPVFVSQYWILVLYTFIVNFFIALLYSMVSTDSNKIFVVFLTCINGLLVVPRSYLALILQATNQIKENSVIIILERIIYFVFVLTFLLLGIRQFEYILIADIIGKICSIIYSIIICKELVFGKFDSVKNSFKELIINVSVGSKLMFANLANMLILGIVRLFIEFNWSVETFGKVSLTLSITNMVMIFINALGTILFPTLRRVSKEYLPEIYKMTRTGMIIPLLGIIVFYFPVKTILSQWLSQYVDSLIYMALLFPICIYESKILLLIFPYLKTLRKEKEMLIINLSTVGLSVILSSISVLLLENLELAFLSITFLLAFRCIIAELFLSKILEIKVKKDLLLEIIMTIIFITTSWYLKISNAVLVYSIAYYIYLVIKKDDIIYVYNKVRILLKSKQFLKVTKKK